MAGAGAELPARSGYRVPAVTVLVPAGEHNAAGPRFLVTVGTDHHPFNRLISWTNDWLGQHPDKVQAFFVQSGAASIDPACPGSRFLEVDELTVLLDAADVIVCHGGPASIASAWMRGQLPIVVPRMARLGEHVDDHQVDFCRTVAELGRVRLAQTPEDFAGLLDQAVHDHARFRTDVPGPDVDAAVARFGELVEELVEPVTVPAAAYPPKPASPPSARLWHRHTGRCRDEITGTHPGSEYELARHSRVSARRPRRNGERGARMKLRVLFGVTAVALAPRCLDLAGVGSHRTAAKPAPRKPPRRTRRSACPTAMSARPPCRPGRRTTSCSRSPTPTACCTWAASSPLSGRRVTQRRRHRRGRAHVPGGVQLNHRRPDHLV